MPETNEATSVGPNPPKPKHAGGRPRKVQPVDNSALLAMMAKQIETLQEALKERHERQEATLAPVPEANDALPPGTYVKIGIDASGSPIMSKVRWTKRIIDETYAPVTFTPMREMTVGPHGILYRVEAGKETTVPKIVKDFYDAALKQEEVERQKTRPMSANERAELDARAMESPGKHMSRLARVGYGLNVQTPDAPETPAT